MDWEFVKGLISGGVLWQLLRSVGGHFFKQWRERKAAEGKLLLADVEQLAKLVDPLFRLATTYYGAPSALGVETARSIRMEMRTFAMQWNAVSAQLRALERPDLRNERLIAFRQALTAGLDVQRTAPLGLETVQVSQIFTATQSVREALSKLRYELID